MRPHPSRTQILDVMRSYGKPISPTQIARITNMTLGSTAYHVRALVAAGLLELADEGRVRGAVEHFYRLVPGEADEELDDPIMSLLGLCGALTIPGEDGGYPVPAVIDEDAGAQLQAILERVRKQVQGIVKSSTARAQGAPERPKRRKRG